MRLQFLRLPRPIQILVACAALALSLGALPGAALAQQCPSIVWNDEFDGSSLDTTKWEPMIGDGCTYGICGWGNNELQYYKAENATVAGGTLQITAKEERVRGKQYTSARLRTLGNGDFAFGRMEARIRMTTGQGIWPAFWMLSTDEVYGGWPQSGEIDIMENIGNEPSTVHGTIHYGDPYPNNQSSSARYDLLAGAFADDFHTFAVEREAGVIRWFVDDVLYATRTTADIAPFNWPFDENFHFLLNVAVGGNWPGNPDATTVFPQVLEVDYVRVLDGNQPHIAGDRVVAHQESGVAYSIGGTTGGTTYSWSVPAGATIASGQGSGQITVDWGADGGDVTVDVSDACGSRQLTIAVEVEPPYVQDVSFEPFDTPGAATLTSTTGTLTEVANPDTSGINPSALVGNYVRNSAEVYDLLAYSTSAIADAGAYVDKTRKFFLDVTTAEAPGTTVLVQLEDSSVATPSNYPAGRHSRYQAQITEQNTWQRLQLDVLDQPDASTGDGAVDTIILFFEPNSTGGGTYVFDNFDGYLADDGGDPPADPTVVFVQSIAVGTQGVGQGKKAGVADVTIHDDLGDPVAGAQVAVTFSGDIAETVAGTTGGDGSVSLQTTGTASGNVSVTACVDDVVASLPYDPQSNVATCD